MLVSYLSRALLSTANSKISGFFFFSIFFFHFASPGQWLLNLAGPKLLRAGGDEGELPENLQ